MDIEKVGIHIRNKYSGGIIGLTIMFTTLPPIDIDVSWINNGHELDFIKEIFTNLTNDTPIKCTIDEEGEFIFITPTLLTDKPNQLQLEFEADRRNSFDTFTVTVDRAQFKDEFDNAIKNYEQKNINN